MKIKVDYSHKISPFGRAGGFHMLCCQGFDVKYYDFTLGRLAYESLRHVQGRIINPCKKWYHYGAGF